jgi:hypothetical protein
VVSPALQLLAAFLFHGFFKRDQVECANAKGNVNFEEL